MVADVETVVVGGGVVGLACALSLARAGHNVVLVERHDRVGTETSSRNSEVIHAGLYYPQGSLRARLCVEGKRLLYKFCEENGVDVRRYGKLLVAVDEAEIPKLEAVASTAAGNGVGDLVRLNAEDVRAIEPQIACVAAYLSPSTGVIDSHQFMLAIEGHVASLGGEIVLNNAVTKIFAGHEVFKLETLCSGTASSFTARNLVLSGGLGATELGQMLSWPDGYTVPKTCPARGHYFALAGRAPFRHLVYPMPVGAWLGVHLTLDVAGRAKFGPDIEWCDSVNYQFDEQNGKRQARFETSIRRFWPGLPNGALIADTVGVRPKIYREGDAVADFAIHGRQQHGLPRLIALYGIESPGLTSSLAIGDYVSNLLEKEIILQSANSR